MADTFPHGTQELYEFLGALHPHGAIQHAQPNEQAENDNSMDTTSAEPAMTEPAQLPAAAQPTRSISVARISGQKTIVISKFRIGSFLKEITPYLSVFVVAFVVWLVFMTNFSVKQFWQTYVSAPKPATQQAAAAVSTIPSDQMAAYYTWINSYFYDVSDPTILAPDNDISGNGLTNYQKFLLNLNPNKTDTIGLGMSDTQALLAGIDPLTGLALTQREKDIIAQNIDLESISNKLSLISADAQAKSGANNEAGDRFQSLTLNTSVNGVVNIPTLGISAPLIFTKDANNLLNDLPNGLAHYPGTALPGDIGTSYISGHSSNYVWIKGKYNNVFAKLNQLKKFDSFTITLTQTNGKPVILHYVVTAQGIFKADDQSQFASIGKSTVALSTCWPVGTSQNRLVVFAELTQTEMQN